MLNEISCTPGPVMIQGEYYEPIRWGEEMRPRYLPQPELCRDCNVPLGGVHHPGCCVERCPACLGQAISCPCCVNVDDDENVDPVTGHQCRFVRTRTRRCSWHLFRRAHRE
jgi:hypothetical protein